MKTKILLAILPLALLTSCANSQGEVFGRKADAGAIMGGMVGTVVGAYNGNPLKGALIGAGVGLGAGAIADANDARRNEPMVYRQQPTEQSVQQTEVVVVQQPVIIEERVWVGPDLWIYSYHGYRHNGRIYYRGAHIPFHSRPAYRH
jgi:hypothetical protein